MKNEVTVEYPDRNAFTMLELLAVVAIIVILFSLLLPAIFRARNHTVKTVARVEAKQIETALNQYLAHYHKWPSNILETTAYAVTGNLARILEGENAANGNPAKVPFMHFTRFNNVTNPISPWGKHQSSSTNYFYCRFDADYNQVIQGTGVPTKPPADNLRRSVIVWAFNPDVDTDAPGFVVGSWQE